MARTITDHVALIDTRLKRPGPPRSQDPALIAAEPLTAHGIAQQMWGEIAIKQAYLTLTEVLGHLDLLLADGSARETRGGRRQPSSLPLRRRIRRWWT